MGRTKPRVLTIAGSDSGGGAGIQADLKTITALGGFGMSVVTALTAQNTGEVRAVHLVPPEFVAAQLDAVVEDIGVDAAKTGMLAGAETAEAVADRLQAHGLELVVVDPVMVSKSGARLLEEHAVEALTDKLLPRALLVTPNLPEAAALTGGKVKNVAGMKEAARRLMETGCGAVLVKGGHLEGEPVDVLFDGRHFIEVTRPRVDTQNTHGTGCTYSAAIATCLGMGLTLEEAIRRARDALQRGLENALPLGSGHGPLDHGAMFRAEEE